MKIAILPGDGIGTEIVAEAVKVLNALGLKFESETALVGGAAYDALIPCAWLFAAVGATFAVAQALLLTRLAVDDRRAVFAVWGAVATLVIVAVAALGRTVPGLATSALIASLALTAVGIAVVLVEARASRRDP